MPRNHKGKPRIVLCIWGLFVVVVLCAEIFFIVAWTRSLRDAAILNAEGASAWGTVVRQRPVGRGKRSTIEFSDHHGDKYTFESPHAARLGDVVPLVYARSNPEIVRPDGIHEKIYYPINIALGAACLVFTVVSLRSHVNFINKDKVSECSRE